MTPPFSFLRQVFHTAQMYPQKVALALDEQIWTYSELIEQTQRVACHLHHSNILEGQIVFQFVERGFEMICGSLGIMFAGGVYCSLNPTDPPERLTSLLDQMQGRYVLLHEKTRYRFPSAAVQHVVLLDNILNSSLDIKDIDNLPDCRDRGDAFIICTSGTTGRQKAIVHTHKSFSGSVFAYAHWDLGLYTSQQQVLQVASCSWMIHLVEIILPLAVGGTLVLLRPNGHWDMAYFSHTLIKQQVTTITINPATIQALSNYLDITGRLETLKSVRKLCTAGN